MELLITDTVYKVVSWEYSLIIYYRWDMYCRVYSNINWEREAVIKEKGFYLVTLEEAISADWLHQVSFTTLLPRWNS